ncbi:MAG: M20/M25/M40 family metallo-hydrolase [Clostridia bacterium]|nr:M20/M25/M40 family metallo-hydrolase [Clostridia bacterium]MBQ3091309.1 M20/M25/M40 family metallo-hydrolase [Clostridia bacterium]MBQ9926051.1 M20/M25/M40 family metallo-hydrolase [Clostridia bacterium]
MEYIVSQKIKDRLASLLAVPSVAEGFELIEQDQVRCIQEQVELTLIEAPTFHEENRAAVFRQKFEELGLANVHIDRGGNVVGTLKGTGNGPTVLVEGHLDTVFPFGSVKSVEEKEGYLYAPGIGDDTRALAMLLSVIRGIQGAEVRHTGDIIFVGTTREEGMGSLGGMKAFLDDNEGQIDASISIDGANIAEITYEATGFKTYEVNFYGIGGHAYMAFGTMANPLHAAGRAVAKIAALKVAKDPRTTFCVSNFHAGNDAGVHAIPPKATIKFNFRSNSAELLDDLNDRIFAAIQEACDEETACWGKDTITWDSKIYCDVPAGTQDVHAPIVEGVYSVIEHLGIEPVINRGGSTNCNMAIGKRIPAICIGRGYYPKGTKVDTLVHNLGEKYPIEGAYKGVQETYLMALLCAGVEGVPSIIEK